VGRIVLIIADTLSGVSIGETIPEGTLGWDKNSGSFSRVSSGSWVASLAQASTGALTANVTGDVTGNVTGNVSIPSTGSRTQSLGNGASAVTGVIDEQTTLSLVALATNGATQIPASSRVLAVFAYVTEVINIATAIEIGITAVDTDGYLTTMAVAAGTKSVAQGALVGLAAPRSAATTYTILANGQPNATGKVRVKIVYETLTAPTS
jgi:hypothetical protein